MDKYLYEESRLKLAHRAKTFGFASLILAIVLFSFPYVSIGFGCLSILFAILSKGYKPKIDKDAKIGIGCACVSIIIGFSIFGSTFYKLYSDADFRQQCFDIINEMTQSYYGEDYSDIYEDLFDVYDSSEPNGGDGLVGL